MWACQGDRGHMHGIKPLHHKHMVLSPTERMATKCPEVAIIYQAARKIRELKMVPEVDTGFINPRSSHFLFRKGQSSFVDYTVRDCPVSHTLETRAIVVLAKTC